MISKFGAFSGPSSEQDVVIRMPRNRTISFLIIIVKMGFPLLRETSN
jgi:hypothetical protein